uniref:FAD:protein FMN transferase n=1 Tax=Agathobacter sp. TaxID=2021311 RepID=UPI004056F4D3
MMKRFTSILLLLSMTITLFTGCQKQVEKFQKSNFYFDTIITIIVYEKEYEAYIDDCFQLAAYYEKLFSATVADSDVSRINANAGSFVEVDRETTYLIEKAIEFGTLSNGLFTISIGPLSNLWNISEIIKTMDENRIADASYIPTETAIQERLSHVGDSLIELNGNLVRLTDSEAAIDLGGIAKGYIADRMKDYLVEKGVTSGIINLGGNVLTLSEKPDGSLYSLGVQKPFAETGESIAIIEAADKSVVSSGNYERYFLVDGRIYHHILNPKTGYPVENELYEVTIISDSSLAGDALSTTCFALGLEEGMKLIESLENTEAIFITNDYEIHTSSGIGTEIPFKEM